MPGKVREKGSARGSAHVVKAWRRAHPEIMAWGAAWGGPMLVSHEASEARHRGSTQGPVMADEKQECRTAYSARTEKETGMLDRRETEGN